MKYLNMDKNIETQMAVETEQDWNQPAIRISQQAISHISG